MLVYPPEGHKTDSRTIFFIGSADSYCKINNKDVALSDKNNFAHIVSLDLGENIFEIEILK